MRVIAVSLVIQGRFFSANNITNGITRYVI